MTVTECPRCREKVTLPMGGGESSRVRCPLCQEEYALGDVWQTLPPRLQLIDEEGYADSHIGYDLAPETEPSSASSKPGFDFEERPAPVAQAPTQTSAGGRGRGRRQKHPGWEFAKIVAGGLLAIPVSQLILWWLPGDWRRDPFKLGPVVGKAIPWIVPKSLRDPEDDSDDGGQSQSPNNNKSLATSPLAKNKQGAKRAPTKQGSQAKRPFTPGKTGKRLGSDPGTPKTVQTPITKQTSDKKTADKKKALAKKGPIGTPTGFSDSRKLLPAAKLRDALTAALRANSDFDAHDPSDAEARSKAATEFYRNLARLSHVVTFVDPSQTDAAIHVSHVDSLLRSFSDKPGKLRLIAQSGESWVMSAERNEPGVILIGAVESIGMRGKWFQTTLQLDTRSKREVVVVSRRNPRLAYDIGEKIILLGSIVDDPRSDLEDYDGEAAFVVAGGYPRVLRRPKSSAKD